MFRTCFVSIIRSIVLYTQQQVYVIQVMVAAGQRDRWNILIPLAISQRNLYVPCAQYQPPDDGHKTCLKHVEFYSKNKFEKLVHLFGFIIRVCGNCLTAWRCVENLRSGIKIFPRGLGARGKQQQDRHDLHEGGGEGLLYFVVEHLNVHRQQSLLLLIIPPSINIILNSTSNVCLCPTFRIIFLIFVM